MIYLILYKSPPQMRHYKYYLMVIHASIGLFDFVAVTARIVFTCPLPALYAYGIWTTVGIQTVHIYIILTIMLSGAMFGIASALQYRWLIVSNVPFSLTTLVHLQLLQYILPVSGLSISIALSDTAKTDIPPKSKEYLFLSQQHVWYFDPYMSTAFRVFIGLLLFCILFIWTMCCITVFSTVKGLNSNLTNMSVITRRMHRQCLVSCLMLCIPIGTSMSAAFGLMLLGIFGQAMNYNVLNHLLPVLFTGGSLSLSVITVVYTNAYRRVVFFWKGVPNNKGTVHFTRSSHVSPSI